MSGRGPRSLGAIFSAVDHRAIMLAAASDAVRIMVQVLVLWLCAAIRMPSKRGQHLAKMIDRRADHRRGDESGEPFSRGGLVR
jgi:hypothetical protein